MPWSPTTLTTSSRNCATSATQIVVPIHVSMCTAMLPLQKSASLIPIASIHQPVLKQLVAGLLKRKSSLVFVQIIQLSHLPLSIIIIVIPLSCLVFFKSIKVKYCTINPFLRDCTRSSVCNLEGKTIRSNKTTG